MTNDIAEKPLSIDALREALETLRQQASEIGRRITLDPGPMYILHPRMIADWASFNRKPTSEDRSTQAMLDYWWHFFRETDEGRRLCDRFWDWPDGD